MSFSHTYGPADEAESTATLQRALDLGCDFLDTADIYGAGHNESLVGRILGARRNDVILATKCGFIPGEKGTAPGLDGSPRHILEACDASLGRLGTDVIDLYYLHRVDPKVPIEDSVGAMASLVQQGKVRHLGLSEVSANTLRRAFRVHPIAAVQSEYSLWTRDPEQGIFPACRELGVAFVAFSPVGRGFLTGGVTANKFEKNDFRNNVPRFSDENFARNLQLVETLKQLAERRHCTAAQLALAWVLAQGDFITAIPGTRRRNHLEENWGALDVHLSEKDLGEIRQALPETAIAGERYTPEQMARVDRS
jgi:aryl-alcohol dehydrogenase-like predicted oxidoreductase